MMISTTRAWTTHWTSSRAWLLAAYGTRLQRVALSLESYYGPLSECFGIVSVVLDRGVRSDGSPETRETLPSREVCGHAEGLFTRLYPMVRFTRQVRSRRSPCRVIPHICRDRCFGASPDRVAAAVWTVGFRCGCSEATVAGTPAKPHGRHSMAPIPHTCWSDGRHTSDLGGAEYLLEARVSSTTSHHRP